MYSTNGQAERIRLSGIDCPEKGQAFGKQAKQFASTLIHSKEVPIQCSARIVTGVLWRMSCCPMERTLAENSLGRSCVVYRQYSKDVSLGALEEEARQAKRGLWADPNPIPPWEIRHPKQGRTPGASGSLSSEPREKPDTRPMAIIGNRHSQVYHRRDGPNYTATAPKNRVLFTSEAEAEVAGYHRARNCP